MSNYSQTTFFGPKDSLPSGNPSKIILGAQYDVEFSALSIAIATKVDGTSVFFPNGSAGTPSVGFTSNAGTGMYNTAGVLSFATSSTQRLSINTTGNLVVAGPTSGFTLSLTAATATTSALQLNAVASGFAAIEFDTASVTTGFIGTAGAANHIVTGSAAGDMVVRTQGGAVRFSTSSGASTQVSIAGNGQMTVGTTASAVTNLVVSAGGAGNFAAQYNASGVNSVALVYLNANSAGIEALRIDGSATTGAAVPTLASNKPGGSTSTGKWIPINLDGTRMYIPAWA